MTTTSADGGRHDLVQTSNRLDHIDKQIVAMLQVDGRASYSRISRKVGTSEGVVRSRVKRLRQVGVLQIVAVTDPLQLGFSHEAMIGIRGVADPAAAADVLTAIDEVDFVVLVAGSFDLLLEVVAESDEHFLALISRIRDLVEPGNLLVLPYLKTCKQQYAWGVR